MTIVLPKNPSQFRQGFDQICDRIRKSDQDETFFVLFVQLIAQLRGHPLLKEIIDSGSNYIQPKTRRIQRSCLRGSRISVEKTLAVSSPFLSSSQKAC